MIELTKSCEECGQTFGQGDKPRLNFLKAKYCGWPCYRESVKFAPKRADRLFWPKVNKGPHPKGCWRWHKQDQLGYGRFLRSGPYAYAHRTAWIITNGPIPDGMEVAHHCDVRNCCNPNHFFLATHDENMKDCKAKGRTTRGEKNRRGKLTEAQARAILSIKPETVRGSGALPYELAAQHGVKVGAIWNIWRGTSWAYLQHDGDGGGSGL